MGATVAILKRGFSDETIGAGGLLLGRSGRRPRRLRLRLRHSCCFELPEPGVFVAGEMLDWEAPTGGYLLTASMASGAAAARGAVKRLGL